MNDSLRFPIGKFDSSQVITAEQRGQWVTSIAELPADFRSAVAGLTAEQLDTPYRPGGWTIRQVVHHVPESHLFAYSRFKLALTEELPDISIYREDRAAELPDYRETPLETSLALLSAVHERWAVLLRSMSPVDFKRAYNHPEKGPVPLEQALGLYAWHGRHHLAHVTSLLQRMGW